MPPPEGTQLSALLPSDAEIARWLREAMEVHRDVDGATIPYAFLVLSCPPMRLKLGFVEFVCSSCPSRFWFFCH